MAELEAAKAEVERRIGRGEENGMRLHDRVLAYHIAKAYMIGQMDVKKAMALSNPHPHPNPNPNPSPHPNPHPYPHPHPHPAQAMELYHKEQTTGAKAAAAAAAGVPRLGSGLG